MFQVRRIGFDSPNFFSYLSLLYYVLLGFVPIPDVRTQAGDLGLSQNSEIESGMR